MISLANVFNVAHAVFLMFVFVNVLMAVFIIFFGRRNPASTWVWLILLVMMPIVGFFAYLMFGQEGRKEKQLRKKSGSDKELNDALFSSENGKRYKAAVSFQKEAHRNSRLAPAAGGDFYSFSLSDVIYHNLNVENAYVTGNNDVTAFHLGEDKINALCEDIKNAQSYIHMEYYIIKNDKTGNRIIDALAERAKAGVEVKLCYDGMGCLRTKKSLFKRLSDAGGQAVCFFPPLVPSVNIRINFRNHRKIAVIDGKIGYIGGINVGDEYLGLVKRFGFWRDMHLRIEGGAVSQLQTRFMMDWNFAAKESPLAPEAKYFPVLSDDFTKKKVQIVSSGPDTDHANIRNLYFKMINEAEKSIYFTTPYFVPDDSILAALKVAALSGIDVRLIFPGKPDHPFVYWASLSYVSELLEAGVKCYRYEKGFIHSKMLVVDGVLSTVGTANMDIRSFELNFETNAVIYDEVFGGELCGQFIKDQNDSMLITQEWYDKRPAAHKVKEAVSRLISPIL